MNNVKRWIGVIAVLVAMVAVAPFSNAQAPAGALRNVNGATVAVADLRGHVTVLAFGGALDPQSLDELPMLGRLASRYSGKGVEVYWVSVDPDRSGASGAMTDAELTTFAAQNGFHGQILRDPAGDVLRSVNTGRKPQLPTFVVLDANGAVVGKPVVGFDPDSDLSNQISNLIDRALR